VKGQNFRDGNPKRKPAKHEIAGCQVRLTLHDGAGGKSHSPGKEIGKKKEIAESWGIGRETQVILRGNREETREKGGGWVLGKRHKWGKKGNHRFEKTRKHNTRLSWGRKKEGEDRLKWPSLQIALKGQTCHSGCSDLQPR